MATLYGAEDTEAMAVLLGPVAAEGCERWEISVCTREIQATGYSTEQISPESDEQAYRMIQTESIACGCAALRAACCR
jgi:hypothetical protein